MRFLAFFFVVFLAAFLVAFFFVVFLAAFLVTFFLVDFFLATFFFFVAIVLTSFQNAYGTSVYVTRLRDSCTTQFIFRVGDTDCSLYIFIIHIF